MSLIQEALKRKTEEKNVSAPPVLPMAAPPESSMETSRPNPFMAALVVLAVLGLAVFLTGISIYLIRSKPAPVAKTEEKTAAPQIVKKTEEQPVAAQIPLAPVIAVETNKIEVTEPAVSAKVETSPAPESPIWPEIVLSGIGQGDGQKLAILNGKMLAAGRTIGNVLLVEVNDSCVVIELSGERKRLYINE